MLVPALIFAACALVISVGALVVSNQHIRVLDSITLIVLSLVPSFGFMLLGSASGG